MISRYLLILLVLSSCVLETGEEEIQKPEIISFSADPISVREGGSVTLSVDGTDFTDCEIFVNGEKSEKKLTLTGGYSHKPKTLETEYKAVCSGPGGTAEAIKTVNIILTDDTVKADSIASISEKFDFSEIENEIKNKFDWSLQDYDPSYMPDFLSRKPKIKVISVSDKTSSFDAQKSVLWGFEGNLNKVQGELDTRCLEEFDFNDEARAKATYAKPQNDSVDAVIKEYVRPEKHIIDFEAVTQSLEEPVPAGTIWEASFGISETVIEYSNASRIYADASGNFSFSEESGGDGALLYKKLSSKKKQSSNFIHPNLPSLAAGNGYSKDPEGPGCNFKGGNVVASLNKMCDLLLNGKISGFEVQELLRDGKQVAGKTLISKSNLTDYCIPPFTWPVTGSQAKLLDARFSLNPTSHYLKHKFPSNRVKEEFSSFNCGKLFKSEAKKKGVDKNPWFTNTAVQYYVDKNGTKHERTPGNELQNFDGEPAKNQCIDRWQGKSYESYKKRLWADCENAEPYKSAKEAQADDEKDAKMVELCTQKNDCKTFIASLKAISELNLSLASLRNHIEPIETDFLSSKAVNKRYLIPASDPWFSKTNDLEKIISGLEKGKEGKSGIYNVQDQTGGDWMNALEKLVKKGVPEDLNSRSKVESSLEDFKGLLKRMRALMPIKVSTYSCNWKAVGGFEVFEKNAIKSIKNRRLESDISIKLKNHTPVPIGD